MSKWDAEKFLDKVADYTAVARYLDNEMQEGKDEVTALANLAEKMGMDYHIHSADEFILVSEMEEAVLIYMEAIKNLLAI